MSQPYKSTHCINPDCPRPYPRMWGDKFCNACGSPLLIKNRYIPLQRLGAGGFATIYTIWDLKAQTEQVLKVLVEASPKALELFEQEAAVLASLRHPGIPRVESDGYFQVSLGKQRQLPALVMEKIKGQTLQEVLEQHSQGCSQEWVIRWISQALEILRELHSRQIIHRDIKPSNLMLRDQTGQLVVIDFGGAKQIGPARSVQASSTRLFSSGYSPPEQIAGRIVGPSADFYALGRTMIHLLTGKYPPDLEDSRTGKLRWRTVAAVSPAVADLLDDLVQEDVRQRPATAAVIQERLVRIAQNSQGRLSFFKQITQLAGNIVDWSWTIFTTFTEGLSRITLFLLKSITRLVRAGVDTVWGMVLGAIGACVGTVTGFVLTYWLPVGAKFAGILSQQSSRLVPDIQIAIEPEILIFVAAGLGTALGLTVAGSFGQRRRYLVAALMGTLAYGLGWLLQAQTGRGIEPLMELIAVASLLTLGLGLPSHHLVHTLVASTGSAVVFAILATFTPYPSSPLWRLFSSSTTGSLLDLWTGITFFSTLSIALSFWLGVSYYFFVPLLRFLGWR